MEHEAISSPSPVTDSASIGSNSALGLHDINRIITSNNQSEKQRIESIRNLGSILAAVRPFQLPFYSFAGHNVSLIKTSESERQINLVGHSTNCFRLYLARRMWGYWSPCTVFMVPSSVTNRFGSFVKERIIIASKSCCRLSSGINNI